MEKSKFWVFCYCSSNKTDVLQIFKNTIPFSGMNFKNDFEIFEFLLSFCGKLGKFIFFVNTKNAILMTSLCVFITSEYVITFWYCHLHVLISELIQSKSALKTLCFRIKKISWIALIQIWFFLKQRWVFSSDQRWFKKIRDQLWDSASQRWGFLCSLN